MAVTAVALGVAVSAGCAGEASSATQVGRQAAAATNTDIPEVLARVDGQDITMTDVRGRIGDDLDQMESMYQRQRHKAIQAALQQLLREKVILARAQKEGTTVDAMVLAEAGGSLDPTDLEVEMWYRDNRARLGGRSLEEVRTQIAQYLHADRQEQALAALERRLNAEADLQMFYEPYRIPLENGKSPALGPADAPVTLVEFSDFECPFCGQFFPTLKRIEENYGDRVRIVYRQYPIVSLHANAFKAAEASLCAHDQGKFWEMHDLLFQEQKRMSVRDLKDKAGRLGLDQGDFDACLDSGRYVEQVQEDLREGKRFGINGTPALFLNGVPVEGGAVAYDVIARLIDAELARVEQTDR